MKLVKLVKSENDWKKFIKTIKIILNAFIIKELT